MTKCAGLQDPLITTVVPVNVESSEEKLTYLSPFVMVFSSVVQAYGVDRKKFIKAFIQFREMFFLRGVRIEELQSETFGHSNCALSDLSWTRP